MVKVPNPQSREIQAVFAVQLIMAAEAERLAEVGRLPAAGPCCSITGRDRMESVLGAGRWLGGVSASGMVSGHLVVNWGKRVGSKMAGLVAWAAERAAARCCL